MSTREHHTTRKAAVGLLAVAGLALAGCGADEPDTGTEVEDITEGDVAETSPPATEVPPAAPATPYGGAYNRQFYDDRAVYEGQDVTLSAEVEEVVSPSALTIGDPDDLTLDPLLVVHDLDVPDLEEGQTLEVVGMVQEGFEVTAAEELVGVDLEDALFEDHAGDPWLHATDATVTAEE
ncbi:hypothetical protein RCG67_16615 [Kocuria sp. CPCC 205292]|uniref:hypothetical protein n=1 Tax=Kocuria cellulosilytica TaxID=3071451 RepID=UPI0034D4B924